MKTQLLTLSLLIAATAAVAQTAPAQPVAKIVASEGLVTVGFQNQMSNAAANMPLFEGARVMTTSTGKASIAFASGCRVALKPNEVFSVSESECKALMLGQSGPVIGTPAQNALVLAGVGGMVLGLIGGSSGNDAPLSGN